MIGTSELIVDSFAGGGGASLGIELALGRSPDIAINHDAEAIALHQANHPTSSHYREDVWKVDPMKATGGRPVGLMWLSPDCKHFSKAKGGKPVSPRVRGLAWVAIRWANAVRPRVICLENVEEFQTWGPLVRTTQKPCPARRGKHFRAFVRNLERIGYRVEYRQLRGCDYGAPTIRKRIFLVARCDGQPIVWPKPTHAKDGRGGLQPWRAAWECIDWSLPCPSIFERPKPLAENTQRRIAAGLRRYVIDSPRPFLVPMPDTGVVAPFLAGVGGRKGQSPETSVALPYHTITAKADTVLVAPFIASYYGAKSPGGERAASLNAPLPTQPTANRFGLVTAFLAKHQSERGNEVQAASLFDPAPTIKTRDSNALVTISLGEDRSEQVHAFLMKYYGTPQDPNLFEPLHTIPTKDRFAVVTVNGAVHQITDIGMRMLAPRELYRAQGFPDSYRIESDITGKPLSKAAQVRMCGNSVCPPVAAAIVAAQFGATRTMEIAA